MHFLAWFMHKVLLDNEADVQKLQDLVVVVAPSAEPNKVILNPKVHTNRCRQSMALVY